MPTSYGGRSFPGFRQSRASPRHRRDGPRDRRPGVPVFVRKEEPVLARIELTPTAPFDEEQPSSGPVPASLLRRWAGRDPTCLLRLRRRQEQPPRRATYRHRSYQTPRVEAGLVSAGNGGGLTASQL